MERKVMSCGVLVFRESPERAFLLLEHSDRFDLPKGHREKGESERECALRELEEETGIAQGDIALDPDFRYAVTYRVPEKRFGREIVEKTLVVFLGTLRNEVTLALTEHRGFRWVPFQPPHKIQTLTIDPLLDAVSEYLAAQQKS
jgi:8-oxo-dGTP pyrophosphatase MutT (NUDIX family)